MGLYLMKSKRKCQSKRRLLGGSNEGFRIT